MHDEAGVRVSHRVEHVEEEPHDRCRAEPVRAHVLVDALAVHVLEHEVRLPGGAHAGVEQARDAGVLEAREHRSFAPEALLSRA